MDIVDLNNNHHHYSCICVMVVLTYQRREQQRKFLGTVKNVVRAFHTNGEAVVLVGYLIFV